jgi:hypothetical protein
MKILPLALSVFALSGATRAATVVISQPTFSSLSDFPPTGFGQSFTTNGKYSITAINLYLSSSAGGSDITLRLYEFDALASKLGSVIQASGVLLESSLSPAAAWRTVTLAVPLQVLSGSTYAFTIIAKDPGGSATGWNNYGVNSADVYAGGSLLGLGSGGSVTKQISDLSFEVLVVPEPAVSGLFAMALAVAAGLRVRRPGSACILS